MDISLDEYIEQNFHRLGLATLNLRSRKCRKNGKRAYSARVGKSKLNAKTFAELKFLWGDDDWDEGRREPAKLQRETAGHVPDLRLKIRNKSPGKLRSYVVRASASEWTATLDCSDGPSAHCNAGRQVCTYDGHYLTEDSPSPLLSDRMDVDDDEDWRGNRVEDEAEDREQQPKSANDFVIEIRNLNSTVAKEDIEELFGVVGPILKIVEKNAGSAQVTFGRLQEALCAIQLYHNRLLDGKPMDVTLCGAYGRCQDSRSDTINALRSCNDATPWECPVVPRPQQDAVRAALFKETREDSYMFTVVLPKLKKSD